jgi:hypothetical protein
MKCGQKTKPKEFPCVVTPFLSIVVLFQFSKYLYITVGGGFFILSLVLCDFVL